MVVHRIAPTCLECKKPYKAINDIKKSLDGFIGDIFIRWEKDCECIESLKIISHPEKSSAEQNNK